LHRTVPESTVRVCWQPGPPIWQRFGSDPDPDPKWRSGTVANTTHADTTELRREAETLKIRAAALSTLLVMRLDWLSSYGCGDCTGLLGATLGSTSAERPQYRSVGHDEQGAAAVVAAEVLHTDSAWMTATGSPSNEGRDRTAGLGSFVGELLRTRPPGFSLHRFHPLRITNWANTDGADMKSYEFVQIYSSEAIWTIASSKAHSVLPDRRPYEPLFYESKSDAIPPRERQIMSRSAGSWILILCGSIRSWILDPKPECWIMDFRSRAEVPDHGPRYLPGRNELIWW